MINAVIERARRSGAIAVFHNHALVARVLPIYNIQTEEAEPLLQEWP